MALIDLPWSLKVCFAALTDAILCRAFGFRRPWVVVAQLGTLVATLGLALTGDRIDLKLLGCLGFVLNCCRATFSAAMDAMASRARTVDGKPTSLFDVGYNRIGMDDGSC